MKVFTRIGMYDPKRSFKSWLGKIMVNMSIDHYRANHKHLHHDDLELAYQTAFSVSIIDKRSYDALMSLVQQLPPSYRTVFNRHAGDGYKHEEIAVMWSFSVGVRKRVVVGRRVSGRVDIGGRGTD